MLKILFTGYITYLIILHTYGVLDATVPLICRAKRIAIPLHASEWAKQISIKHSYTNYSIEDQAKLKVIHKLYMWAH